MKLLRFTWLGVLFYVNTLNAQLDSANIKLNIFPNPNAGTFYITLVEEEAMPTKLINNEGQVIKTLYLEQGLNYISIDVPSGLYILSVKLDDTIEHFKIKIN